MKTEFSTHEYEMSHGRKPKGRGMWAFQIDGTDGHGGWTTLDPCAFFSGTLSEGKRQAKQYGEHMAREVGAVRELYINVLP